jgi:hypothetical protein
MIYTFDSALLSSQKLGSPQPPSSSYPLSGKGVNTISLSTQDIGISFNEKSDLSGVLINCTVQGSLFRIDRVYHQSQMVLLKGVALSSVGTGTIFQFVSSGSVGVGLSAGYRDFTTPETRRKTLYGYR